MKATISKLQRFKKTLVVLVSCISILTLATGFYLSDLFLFPFGFKDRPPYPHCSSWLKDEAFSDLSSGQRAGPDLEGINCEKAIETIQFTEHQLIIEQGKSVRLVEFDSESNYEEPIWLHVHGVTGDYLHASRYLPLAKRFGAKLFAIEYRNHGLSFRDGKGAGWGCKEQFDLIEALHFLHSKRPKKDIFITSSSMGTMTTALALAKLEQKIPDHRVKLAFFESPIVSVTDLVRHTSEAPPLPGFLLDLSLKIAEWKADLDLTSRECTPKFALQNLPVPAVIQSSELDIVTPKKLAEMFVKAIPKAKLEAWKHYRKGFHSTVWNGQPKDFERDMQDILKKYFSLKPN